MSKKYTIFCDIDGTLMYHHNQGIGGQILNEPIKTENMKETIRCWDRNSYIVVLTTGRKESLRALTEKQLLELGILFDHLVMGLSNGPRVLINDKKQGSINNTAHAINLVRNAGMHVDQYTFHCFNPCESLKGKVVEKPWGSETWVEVNDQYVVKKLFMKAGNRCSLQHHDLKKETICVLSGKLKLHIGHYIVNENGDTIPNMEEPIIMGIGDTITINPLTIHRMEGIEDSVYLETSTIELWDVVRLEDDYKRV